VGRRIKSFNVVMLRDAYSRHRTANNVFDIHLTKFDKPFIQWCRTEGSTPGYYSSMVSYLSLALPMASFIFNFVITLNLLFP